MSFWNRLTTWRSERQQTARERVTGLVQVIAEGRDADLDPAQIEDALRAFGWTDELLHEAVGLERERLGLLPDAEELPRQRADLERLNGEIASERVTLDRQAEAIRERREELDRRLALARGRLSRAETAAQRLRDVSRGLRRLLDAKGLQAEDAARTATKQATGALLALEAERRDTESRLEAARARLAELEGQRREAGIRDPHQSERELAGYVEALEVQLGRLTQRRRDLEQQRAEAERALEPQA